MAGNELAAAYLDLVRRNGDKAVDLIGPASESKALDTFFKGRFLPCPLFLTAPEHTRLSEDLVNLRAALVSLPERLFGGDMTAFARAVGLTEAQAAVAVRSRGGEVTRFSRADLYAVGDGFKVVEFNMGSTIGGQDNAELAKAMLLHPTLAGFAAEHGLGYVDSRVEALHTMFAETGFETGDDPFFVIADTPANFADIAVYLEQAAALWGEAYGIRAAACHLGELEYRDGGVWLRGQRVDAMYRLFMLEDLLVGPETVELFEPVLAAVERGELRVFTPMDAEAFGSKNALAMVSDEANRHLFTPGEQASLDRLLPWTRILRDGEATLETGEKVDLVAYALANRTELVLKPTMMHGGIGVVLGGDPHITQEFWERQVRGSLDGSFTLQRLLRPEPNQFPNDAGELEPYTVLWGAFTVTRGYGGAYGRAVRNAELTTGVININTGAIGVSCFHATR